MLAVKLGNFFKAPRVFLVAHCALRAVEVLAFAPTPANDNFANATVVSGPTATVTGTTQGSTRESGEPNHAGGYGTRSVWYRYTAPGNGMVTLDATFAAGVGSRVPISPLLAVYTGGSVSALTAVASAMGDGYGATLMPTNKTLGFDVTGGVTYYIAVDAHCYTGTPSLTTTNAYGSYTLNMPTPASNLLTTPANISSVTWLVNGSFGFQISGLLGQTVHVEASTNMVNWDILSVIVLTSGTTNFIDNSAPLFQHRLYRTVLRSAP
jgi:hypothetical protein